MPLEAVLGMNPRRAALLGQLGPQFAIGDVREADDAAPADPEHVASTRGASRTVCKVCERTTMSNWPSAKAASPLFKSVCTTSSPRRTQATMACSSHSMPMIL